MLTSVIETMGYGKFTPTDLNKSLTGKNISVRQSMGETTNEIGGRSDIKNIESLLQLNYLELTEPRLDPSLFNGYVSKMQMQLKFIKSNPQAAFVDTLVNVMYNNNPLRPMVIPTEAQIKSINPQRAVEIYKNEFGKADGYHFFFVGNIDENTLKPLLEQYFGFPANKWKRT